MSSVRLSTAARPGCRATAAEEAHEGECGDTEGAADDGPGSLGKILVPNY